MKARWRSQSYLSTENNKQGARRIMGVEQVASGHTDTQSSSPTLTFVVRLVLNPEAYHFILTQKIEITYLCFSRSFQIALCWITVEMSGAAGVENKHLSSCVLRYGRETRRLSCRRAAKIYRPDQNAPISFPFHFQNLEHHQSLCRARKKKPEEQMHLGYKYYRGIRPGITAAAGLKK